MIEKITLLPLDENGNELGEPLFITEEEYQEFREDFINTVTPILNDWNLRSARSWHEAQTRGPLT